jgi:hypothetical protein
MTDAGLGNNGTELSRGSEFRITASARYRTSGETGITRPALITSRPTSLPQLRSGRSQIVDDPSDLTTEQSQIGPITLPFETRGGLVLGMGWVCTTYQRGSVTPSPARPCAISP